MKEENARQKSEKAAEQKRREIEKSLPDQVKAPGSKVVLRDPLQEELIRRNQQEVAMILKDIPDASPLARPVPVPSIDVEQEDPAVLLIKQAAEEEKRQLEEQRQLIRKDFEDGVERVYSEAVVLFKKKKYSEAYEDFQQVDGLIKGYKKTADYLKDIERRAPSPKPTRALVPVVSSQASTQDVADALDSFDINSKN